MYNRAKSPPPPQGGKNERILTIDKGLERPFWKAFKFAFDLEPKLNARRVYAQQNQKHPLPASWPKSTNLDKRKRAGEGPFWKAFNCAFALEAKT